MMSKGIQESLRTFFSERFLLRQEGPLSTVISGGCLYSRQKAGTRKPHSPQGTLKQMDRLETAWKSLAMGVFFKEKVNSQQQQQPQIKYAS